MTTLFRKTPRPSEKREFSTLVFFTSSPLVSSVVFSPYSRPRPRPCLSHFLASSPLVSSVFPPRPEGNSGRPCSQILWLWSLSQVAKRQWNSTV